MYCWFSGHGEAERMNKTVKAIAHRKLCDNVASQNVCCNEVSEETDDSDHDESRKCGFMTNYTYRLHYHHCIPNQKIMNIHSSLHSSHFKMPKSC
jgi:hypothetical protein